MNLRYVQHTLICLIKAKYSDSPVWTDLPKIRHIYLQGRSFIVNNGGGGGGMGFWVDHWIVRCLCAESIQLYMIYAWIRIVRYRMWQLVGG
jgi:hypothetical protein